MQQINEDIKNEISYHRTLKEIWANVVFHLVLYPSHSQLRLLMTKPQCLPKCKCTGWVTVKLIFIRTPHNMHSKVNVYLQSQPALRGKRVGRCREKTRGKWRRKLCSMSDLSKNWSIGMKENQVDPGKVQVQARWVEEWSSPGLLCNANASDVSAYYLIWTYPSRWNLHKSKEAQPCGGSIILALNLPTHGPIDRSCCWWWIHKKCMHLTVQVHNCYLGMNNIKLQTSWNQLVVGSVYSLM